MPDTNRAEYYRKYRERNRERLSAQWKKRHAKSDTAKRARAERKARAKRNETIIRLHLSKKSIRVIARRMQLSARWVAEILRHTKQ